MLFTRSNAQTSKSKKKKGGKVNHIGLYEATFDDVENAWSNIRPLNLNNKEYFVGHPAITEDGSILYFASDMPHGYGGFRPV